MYAGNVGGFVNLDLSSGSIGFFFLILQDGELPLISPMEIHRYTVTPNYAT